MQIIHDHLPAVTQDAKGNISNPPGKTIGKIQGQDSQDGTGQPYGNV